MNHKFKCDPPKCMTIKKLNVSSDLSIPNFSLYRLPIITLEFRPLTVFECAPSMILATFGYRSCELFIKLYCLVVQSNDRWWHQVFIFDHKMFFYKMFRKPWFTTMMNISNNLLCRPLKGFISIFVIMIQIQSSSGKC